MSFNLPASFKAFPKLNSIVFSIISHPVFSIISHPAFSTTVTQLVTSCPFCSSIGAFSLLPSLSPSHSPLSTTGTLTVSLPFMFPPPIDSSILLAYFL